MEMDGPIIKISSIFIKDESELYCADKISKLIPSPFKVSVRPFKSASDNIFAKIPIILNSDNSKPIINLDCLIAPGANGRTVEKNEIMILDSDSPDLWVLEINPKQQEVGNYFLTLNDNSIKKQVGLIVRNVNDAPTAIDPLDLPKDAMNISILQNQNIEIKHEKNIYNFYSFHSNFCG